jgi:hypothetical protein
MELVWRKSSFSDPLPRCVEVAIGEDDVIRVRDSKDKDGPILEFTRKEWKAFTAGVRAGEFSI